MQKRVKIKNRYKQNLSAIIEMPGENVKDFMVISHCFTCSKLYKLYNNISAILSELGYGVVRYDAMGLGESEGDFSKTSFSTNVEDLLSVYEYVTQMYKKPSYLFGHSIGSLVSIKAAGILDSIKGVAIVGSPSNFDNLINLYSNYEDQLLEKDHLRVNLAGRSIDIGIDYLKDAKEKKVEEMLKGFNKPIIMFHSDIDKTVPYSQGLDLFKQIKGDKSFITLKGADHLVGEKKDSKYIADILYTWMENI